MSTELHPIRLWWCADKGRGIARNDDVEVRLRSRPPVLRQIARLVELEYMPGIACYYVQDATGPRRDMQPGEMAECLAYLRHVSGGTHDLTMEWRP